MNNLVPQDYVIDRQKRGKLKGHNSMVIWFSGLSGSGKSTIANKVEAALYKKGIHTYSLDGDNIRRGLNKDLGFTEEERNESLRRIAEVAKLFLDAGAVVLCAFITPMESDRELVRQILGKSNIVEVFVDTSLEECERRDVKGHYKKARKGEIKNFTGISAPFEVPKNPDLRIKTEDEKIEDTVQRVLDHILSKIRITKND